jgi:multiple sugar transport system ATP-binding protein
MAQVELLGVSKTYDGITQVVRDVSLKVAEGELVVFVGPSGCGKSTLLRMVAGLESISDGQLLIDGQRVNEVPARERDIAMVFQDYALYPHKTVEENMAFALRLRKISDKEIKEQVQQTAELLKIEHLLKRKPAALSGGQRQRVAIGRAIVRQPRVFLFDEPLSNLDAQMRTEMRGEIKRLHQRLGATMIYVTHDQVEAMTLADQMAVLDQGRVIQFDTPHKIYHQPSHQFVASFTGSPPMNLLRVESRQGRWMIVDSQHPLEIENASASAQWPATQTFVMGVRPEQFSVQPLGQNDLSVEGVVLLTELLGSETLIRLALGEQSAMCRVPGEYFAKLGQKLKLYCQPSSVHAFDAESGLRWAS